MVKRAGGVPLARGDSALEAADRFRAERAEVFGAMAAELIPAPLAPGGPIEQPVMYDRQTDSYKFMLVRYQQERQGIPVFRSGLRVLVRSEDSFPVVLAASSLHDLGGFMVDPALAASPFDRLEEIAPEMTSYTEPQVVIWAGVDDMVVEPALAITFTADNYENPASTAEKWLYLADAGTGAVLYRESLIQTTDIVGHVDGMATEGYKAETCASGVPTMMPYAAVAISGGPTYYAEKDGDFTIPYDGTEPARVESYMSGEYFTVHRCVEREWWGPCPEGPTETLSAIVTPGQAYTFTHNESDDGSPDYELIRSQVNAYVAANEVRDWVLEWNPDLPGVVDQPQMPIYVNRLTGGLCPGNAWYTHWESINFCQSGDIYPNMAFRSVVYHEYGHHVILCSGSGQGQYGEGMADSFSVLMTDDHVLGYGWEGDCEVGKRDADNDFQYPCESVDPHVCGNLLSGCIWDVREELIQTEPEQYREILSRLAVNSILLHTETMITPQIAIDFLTLDDDNSSLYDGTPHWAEICAGFGAHGMECPLFGTGLFVDPEEGLASVGVAGGPFTPSQITYTLKNLNDAPIDYTVDKAESWVTLSSPSGTIPAHQSATVAVGIDETEAGGKPYGTHRDTVTFTNTTDHVGDTTRQVELTVAIARFTLGATEPEGWTCGGGEWEFGQPISGGGTHGCPDPGGGATGDNVYGVNLSGDYSTTSGGPYYLVTAEIPLQGAVNPRLRFKRWLNTDHWPYAEATVEASPNGTGWTEVWSSGWVAINDPEWTTQTYDLSEVVGSATTVYVRWGYQIYRAPWAYSGWNIDDVEILGDAAP